MSSSYHAGDLPHSLRLKRHSRSSIPEGPAESVFRRGRNVWQVAHATRASFLIDADAFFRAFAEACVQAEKQILILGWDTDSRTELPRPAGVGSDGRDFHERLQLGRFLSDLTKQKPDLKVYVLSWDFSFIYLFERETLPGVKFSSLDNDQVRFVLDQEHPALASHHQKIVVVDDKVAFTGGLDITQRRWDTPEHHGSDERRVDPGGHLYGPFHDVQICLEGQAAKSLGDLARERWRIATGEELEKPLSSSRPWPPSAPVSVQEVDVGIARSLPYGYVVDSEGLPSRPVKEVEKLFVDMIRSAKSHIYLEHQYFTSPIIAHAIAERLKDPLGPEVLMVLPRDQTGLIEESTMGVLRSKALKIVEDADASRGRFRCFYPVVPNLEHGYVKVHSKVTVIDDEILRIGSANLNNRSLGLDTECDVAIESCGRRDIAKAIAELRATLLGEHLGVSPEEFHSRFVQCGSLLKTVESFRGGERNLVEINSQLPTWVSKIMPPEDWVDPTAPYGIRRWFARRIEQSRHSLAAILIFGTLLILFLLSQLEEASQLPQTILNTPSPQALALDGWHWLRSWDAENIAERIEAFRHQEWAIPLVLFGFVLGSFLFIPISVMILGVALAYPSGEAFVLAYLGSILAALATYGLGRYWAWSKSRFLHRPWIKRLSNDMAKGGVWAMTAVRLAPIGPFMAVSLVSGGIRVPIRDYLIGTALGLLPGLLAITLITESAASLLSEGHTRPQALFIWAILVFLGFSFLAPRLIRRMRMRG